MCLLKYLDTAHLVISCFPKNKTSQWSGVQINPTLISTWNDVLYLLLKVWHSHFHWLATLMMKVSSLMSLCSALKYSALRMTFMLFLYIFTTSHYDRHLRAFVISWKKSAVKETDAHAWMSKYEVMGDTLSNDGEVGGQIPTGDQMFPVPFAPCTPSAP